MYLLNAFSIQMVDTPCTVNFVEVQASEVPKNLISAIGHQDTANVLSSMLDMPVECNRVNVHLDKGSVAYVAQLMGGRLPEGSTTLPEGFKIKFLKVTVE